MAEQLKIYLELVERVARQAARAQESFVPIALRELMRYVVRGTGASSAYVCEYDPKTRSVTVLSEYIAGRATIAEEVSDLGEVYDSEALGEDLLAWIDANEPTPRYVYVDDLPEDDPERAELIEYGGNTMVYVGVHLPEQMWGFIEIWESTDRRVYSEHETAYVQQIANYMVQFLKPHDESVEERDS